MHLLAPPVAAAPAAHSHGAMQAEPETTDEDDVESESESDPPLCPERVENRFAGLCEYMS